jgi:2,3-bisphosphoglycerate-independent phosphoglycerate mutase
MTFFFLHIKRQILNGEDGNWEGKVKVIEDFDKNLPKILGLKPSVLVITGDHSTPLCSKDTLGILFRCF